MVSQRRKFIIYHASANPNSFSFLQDDEAGARVLDSPKVPRAEHRWIAAQRGKVMMKQSTKDRESHTEDLEFYF